MKAGMIYSCKWQHGHGRRVRMGWDMLMFLRIVNTAYEGGIVKPAYLFLDLTQGERVTLDEGLIKHCKELILEEV